MSPHRSPVCPPPAPPGGAAARHPSGLDALGILGRALEAERSWGLAIAKDGRAANGAGSLVALAGWRRVPFLGFLSVIGSLRFPWGRGAAAGAGLLPAGLEPVGIRTGPSGEVPRERRASGPVSKCWRAAGPRGTGSEPGTPASPPGTAGFSKTSPALENAPLPGSRGRVRRAPEPERTCLEWELGEWEGAVASSWRSGLVGTAGGKPETQPTLSRLQA